MSFSLKTLYSLDDNSFNNLRTQLNQERLEIYSKGDIDIYLVSFKNNIDSMISKQSLIKNKIPFDKLNMVNNFLIDLTTDLNNFKSRIKSNSNNSNNSNKSNNSNNSNNRNNRFSYGTNNQMGYQMDPSILQQNNRNIPQQQHPQQQHSQQQQQNNINIPQNRMDILSSIDPYKLYGIERNKDINIELLKNKYREFALQTHPDKNKGDTSNFIIVKECFKKIVEDYKLKQKDKQFNQLKRDSTSFIEQQTKQNSTNKKIDVRNFNINKFNKVYNENKIDNINDDGYIDWIETNTIDSEDIVRDPTLTTGNFHNKFNNNVRINNSVVKYEKPREMFMNEDNNCEELGKTKIDNYSGKSKSINYTDYKEAYTTSRLVDTGIDISDRNFRDITQLKNDRQNIKEQTEEEIMNIELEKSRKEEEEQQRVNNVDSIDQRYFDMYKRTHNIMIS